MGDELTADARSGLSADDALVSDVGERGLVDRISKVAGRANADVIPIGIGDDGAVVSVPDGWDVVLSTDAIPEDLFAWDQRLISHYELGQYAARVNISDVVAMGARPVALFWTLRVAGESRVSDVLEIARGIADAGAEFGVALAGGDSKSSRGLSLSLTACGLVEKGKAVRRSGARTGEAVVCVGHLGLASAALAYFRLKEQRGVQLTDDVEEALLTALWRPVPQVISANDGWSSCIDNTDGVGRTLLELGRSSRVAIHVDAARLPIHPLVDVVSGVLVIDPVALTFSYGLDLALLGTQPVDRQQQGASGEVTIGHTAEGSGVTVSGVRRGSEVHLDVEQLIFEHFRAPFAEVISRITSR